MTATLNLYRDMNYIPFMSIALEISVSNAFINPDGMYVYIYDLQNYYINSILPNFMIRKKFDYNNIMFELTDIDGALGVEVSGIGFKSAIIGVL